jgi:aspartate/methionine/tyrosine aminotransferase
MRTVMDGRPLTYTPALGLPALRTDIVAFYRERHGVDIDPARIVVTSGASSALLLVLAATTDAGDEVIMADPSYPCNRQLVETFGGRAVTVPTTAASRFQLDDASVAGAWSRHTTAVMIATPSNPTGTSIPFAELEVICARARERGAWRIVDEIYLYLSDPAADGTPPRSVLEVDPDAIVINSFSNLDHSREVADGVWSYFVD